MSNVVAQSVNTVKSINTVATNREANSTRPTNTKSRPSFLSTLLRTLSAVAA